MSYTVRRLTRPKIGNVLIEHHGTQVLSVNGQPAVYQHMVNGYLETIQGPVIDLSADGLVYVKSFEVFAAGRPVSCQRAVDIDSTLFDDRFRFVVSDIRKYSLKGKNCETTTDVLLEGAPANRQYKGLVGLALFGLAIAIIAR